MVAELVQVAVGQNHRVPLASQHPLIRRATITGVTESAFRPCCPGYHGGSGPAAWGIYTRIAPIIRIRLWDIDVALKKAESSTRTVGPPSRISGSRTTQPCDQGQVIRGEARQRCREGTDVHEEIRRIDPDAVDGEERNQRRKRAPPGRSSE